MRYESLRRGRGAVERTFGRLKNEYVVHPFASAAWSVFSFMLTL
jgi:hypothetical protein